MNWSQTMATSSAADHNRRRYRMGKRGLIL